MKLEEIEGWLNYFYNVTFKGGTGQKAVGMSFRGAKRREIPKTDVDKTPI